MPLAGAEGDLNLSTLESIAMSSLSEPLRIRTSERLLSMGRSVPSSNTRSLTGGVCPYRTSGEGETNIARASPEDVSSSVNAATVTSTSARVTLPRYGDNFALFRIIRQGSLQIAYGFERKVEGGWDSRNWHNRSRERVAPMAMPWQLGVPQNHILC